LTEAIAMPDGCLIINDANPSKLGQGERIVYRTPARGAGSAFDCVAPLIVAGKSIGTLNLASYGADEYSDADGELFRK